MLHGADFVERLARLGWQQLVEHPFHRVQGERARRKLFLAGGSDDVGALARMKDERVSIGANDCGQQRGYERHSSPKGVSRSPGFSVEVLRYFIVKTTPCCTGRKSSSWSTTNPIGSISRRISSKLIL